LREVLRVTAVHLASCVGGNGRAPARPAKGAKKQRAKPPISLFLPREMRPPSLVVATDASAAAFWVCEGVGGSVSLSQKGGGFAVARLTQALGNINTKKLQC
jgi:hypothetical protein